MKLLTQINNQMHTTGYSPKTIQAYKGWVKDFILFNDKKHPKELEKKHLENYLTYLAVKRNVSASTQNQALSALLYLYKNIIKTDIGWLNEVVRARKSRRLPVVFSKAEVKLVINYLEGVPKLIASLLYGSGLRLGEALRLRVKDINFDKNQILVREAKGDKDRITTLPSLIIKDLKDHLNKVFLMHKEDLRKGNGKTKLPYALAKKYPNASAEFLPREIG